MRRTSSRPNPIAQRRITGVIGVVLGLGGVYQGYQVSRSVDTTVHTCVFAVYAASALVVAAGAFAILRPVRIAGWLVNTMAVVLITATAALMYVVPPPTSY